MSNCGRLYTYLLVRVERTILKIEVPGSGEGLRPAAGARRPDQQHAVDAGRAQGVEALPRALRACRCGMDRSHALRTYLLGAVFRVYMDFLRKSLHYNVIRRPNGAAVT